MNHPPLTVRALRCRIVQAPMKRPLGTSVARMAFAPFLLLDLQTEEGITGRAHAFCYMDLSAPAMRRVLETAAELIEGHAVDPAAIGQICRNRFMLLGTQGIVGMALSALDVACWDAVAQAAGQPLARYLGGAVAAVPAYNSNGLGLADPDTLGEEAEALRGEGFDAVKVRLGRADPKEDLNAVRAVRAVMPDTSPLMADYNQALSAEDALRRGAALDGEGLYWIEEPLAHDDFRGSAALAAAIETPVQIGENFTGPGVLATAIDCSASDYVMPDLMRIGGVSGWLRASAFAAAAGVPMSSHLYPEVSVHLLAATPTAHWLEYMDWAKPFLTAGVTISDGRAQVPATPGTGVEWNEDAVDRFALP
jgi:mandelate racemase